jgi:hypothetical protein
MERAMRESRKELVAVFADRATQQWIVRDPAGQFWLLPSVNNPWDHRQPFQPSEETELLPVPRHYKDAIGLPF